mmetsp:Transcript_15008/g.1353  ORF Transcript_15008/g.1353 Transcript_15008/m.1353 type:complete len:88 (-) Transcript_15008:394-657(-)
MFYQLFYYFFNFILNPKNEHSLQTTPLLPIILLVRDTLYYNHVHYYSYYCIIHVIHFLFILHLIFLLLLHMNLIQQHCYHNLLHLHL